MGSFEFKNEIASVQRDPYPQVHTIVLEGDLDISSSPRLREMLNALIQTGAESIVIDCTDLQSIDSSGLGILVGALKQTSDRPGSLVLAQPNDAVRRSLHITGLDLLFPIYNAPQEAREACAFQPA